LLLVVSLSLSWPGGKQNNKIRSQANLFCTQIVGWLSIFFHICFDYISIFSVHASFFCHTVTKRDAAHFKRGERNSGWWAILLLYANIYLSSLMLKLICRYNTYISTCMRWFLFSGTFDLARFCKNQLILLTVKNRRHFSTKKLLCVHLHIYAEVQMSKICYSNPLIFSALDTIALVFQVGKTFLSGQENSFAPGHGLQRTDENFYFSLLQKTITQGEDKNKWRPVSVTTVSHTFERIGSGCGGLSKILLRKDRSLVFGHRKFW